MDCSQPGASVHGILQERILEWVALPSSRGSSQHRNQTHISCIAGGSASLLSSQGRGIGPHDGLKKNSRCLSRVAHGVATSRTRLSDFAFTFHFHALEKEMATHSSVLAWRIPGTAEPGGLPSQGSHRVGHD